MAEQQAVVSAYLLPASEACWSWNADGSAVSWSGGGAMALREDIEAVLIRLAPGGLPPFGAVMLLLAATQEDWNEPGGGRAILTRYVRHLVQRASRPAVSTQRTGGGIRIDMRSRSGPSRTPVPTVANGAAEGRTAAPVPESEPPPAGPQRPALALPGASVVASVLDGLDRVNALGFELIALPESKAVLAEIVFEGTGHGLPAEPSLAVAAAVAAGSAPAAMRQWQTKRDAVGDLLRELEVLGRGLPQLTEERLSMRLWTGLDGAIEPAGGENTPSERIRGLLNRLLDDRELSGMARLARELMAAIHLPRTLTAQDDLPVGGFSDITNRGPLDRLLVSELAHDDLTLAVRVALNEALYLRREAPRRDPPICRGILLDSGVRLWGVPRVFATAVALALAATAGERDFLVFRAKDESIHPVDLLTKKGVVEHLAALETAAHPGAALPRFLEAVARSEEAVESIVVTHADALDDPEFQAAAASAGAPLFVASVERTGEFRLWQQTGRWRRLLGEARLELGAIVSAPEDAPPPKPLLDAAGTRLPLILSMQPFPFRLPAAIRFPGAAVLQEQDVISLTRDGRLLHWRDRQRGPRQLTDRVPEGKLLGIGIDGERAAWVAIGSEGETRIRGLFVDLETGRVTPREMQAGAPDALAVVATGPVLLAMFPDRVEAFDRAAGEKLAELDALPSGQRWQNGRFLGGATGWSLVDFDGRRLLARPLRRVLPDTVAMLQRADGPWGLDSSGTLHSTFDDRSEQPIPAPPRPVRFVGVSSDGWRLALARTGAPKEDYLLSLATLQLKKFGGDPWRALEPWACSLGRTLGRFEPRRKYEAIAALEGSIWLEADDGTVLRLAADGAGGARPRPASAPAGFGLARRRFRRTPGPAETRYRLAEASWESGGRAFLDSRGLLHLCGPDPEAPQLSFTVAESPMAGWSSRGHRFGLAYLLEENPTDGGAELLRAIERIVKQP